jgi:hypothetical protein
MGLADNFCLLYTVDVFKKHSQRSSFSGGRGAGAILQIAGLALIRKKD